MVKNVKANHIYIYIYLCSIFKAEVKGDFDGGGAEGLSG